MEDRDDKKKAAGTGAGAVAGAAVGGVAAGATTGALAGGLTGPVGAAIGAVVGAVVGAAGGRAAGGSDDAGTETHAGTGLSHDGGALHTVIGAFDDTATGQRAVDRLVQAGFAREDVHVEHQQGGAGGAQGKFFPQLFSGDGASGTGVHPQYAHHASTYDEAVRRGSAVVVVDAHGEEQADRAAALLHELGAMDVDERSKQWQSEGWKPSHETTGQNLAAGGGNDVRTGNEGKFEVVEEQLQVGKRTVDRGGVRVIQRVSSRPVREVVRLREEHAVVDRHPADRPATGQDLSTFKEGTLEVRETVEEPVVAKTARVVEEVRVGKDVREREETIEDTVRRKDVEVERLGGQAGRNTERERAVAADPSPGGTRKGGGNDRPI